jgi:dienelactone hydrolase
MSRPLLSVVLLFCPAALFADEAAVKTALGKSLISPRQSLLDLQDAVEARLPRLPKLDTAAAWEKYAAGLRKDVLDRVVLRGEAQKWAAAKGKVEVLGDTAGGEGYKLRKLRYEALPGLWIPAILYVPDKLSGKVPVMLAVNGHDGNGKAAKYKQIRCINLAKRGMLVLNVEWFGMGQLRQPGYQHGCMNQLDLCGTSGLAPFYLAMSRGLDVLLAQQGADASRVAVSGLSGGGWQTIIISSLDPRVTLANPVAGYSGFKIRLRDHFKDLGDSEQTPVDLATLADYTHLTALRAPRPTLLTYNAKDDCCFEAGYALPPLLVAARPVFKLFDQEKALRSHVNHVPGTHNYEKENREAFYRMVGDFFYPNDRTFDAKEIPCDREVKTAADLLVELPKDNASFNSLARALAKELPHGKGDRKVLGEIVKAADLAIESTQVAKSEEKGTQIVYWKLRLGKKWTIPVVELARGKADKTTILLNDRGRQADLASAEKLLKAGHRVLAVDVFYFGESRVAEKDWLFALLVCAVGDRPLGIQASQVAAVARWSLAQHHNGPVQVRANGPRLSLAALVAAALEEKAIAGLELQGCRASLKEVIEQNRTVNQMPEVFCFGLLERFDIPQLIDLVKPRRVQRE